MITVTDLSKSFGAQELLDSISFNVNAGERIGLVGRNGHGKTTLLRIISGEDHADSGEIQIPRDYTLGHVTQHLDLTCATVLEEGCRGLPEDHLDDVWKVEKILSGLGFSQEDFSKSPKEFSGGYQVRLNLVKVLVSEPDMLLLDEPTNYLDIVSIRWLEKFLIQWKGEMILVTHDRTFMDKVTTHIVGIHRKKIRKIEGNTDKLYSQILKEEEIHENTRINDEKKRKETELYISRFRAKARLAGMVQSRIKALEKQEKLDKLGKIKTLDFSFSYKPMQAKSLMNAKNISFSYSDEPLIDGLNLSIGKEDRICVIGKNGKGKTTLLRLLAGELAPGSGEISMHTAVQRGYFAQTNVAALNQALTIEEELMQSGCERQKARNLCGAMMFEGDDALKKIKVLSGGEKSRVLLGKILASESNLLLLDEPTNHLDMESCDALLAAIDDFPGAVIMVTHNELFLNALANRFVVFQGGVPFVFEGSYQGFLDKIGWDDEERPAARPKGNGRNNSAPDSSSKKDLRKQRADIISRRSAALKPLEKRIAEIEKSIESLEKEMESYNEEMVTASGEGRGKSIEELSKKIHSTRSKIDSFYDDFEELTIEYDSAKEKFDRELEELN